MTLEKNPYTPSEVELAQIKNHVLETAPRDVPEILLETPEERGRLVDNMLQLYSDFESERLMRIVDPDTEVVVVLSGPGSVSKSLSGDKNDRYDHLEWSRKMDRARVRMGAHLVHEITAKRLGLETSEVTHDDIIAHGPYLHYAGTEWENEQLKKAIAEGVINVPIKKLFTYDSITDPSGNTRPIRNTVDQIAGLRLPEKIKKIALVDHSAHLVRVLHIMGMYHDRLSGVDVQPFPIKAPSGGSAEYAEMELRGTLAYIYKYGQASTEPYPIDR